MTNPSVETLSDEHASDLFLVKDIKIQTLTDPKNRPEHSLQERMGIKEEIPKHIEYNRKGGDSVD